MRGSFAALIVPKPAPATLGASATMPLPVVEDCGTFKIDQVRPAQRALPNISVTPAGGQRECRGAHPTYARSRCTASVSAVWIAPHVLRAIGIQARTRLILAGEHGNGTARLITKKGGDLLSARSVL